MEKLKNKKSNGITLIALIITIIVMLILVGVTISVALNGGLFTTAQNAATNTMVEAEKEQLLSAVVASMGDDAKVNFTKLDNNLPTSEWTGTNGTYTSPKGNEYTVSQDGTITKNGQSNIKYIYGDADSGYVVLKDNTVYLYMSGQKEQAGTYKEDVDITTLPAYDGYSIGDKIKDFSKFFMDENGEVFTAISDDNNILYRLDVVSDSSGISNSIDIRDELGHRAYNIDLSAYDF